MDANGTRRNILTSLQFKAFGVAREGSIVQSAGMPPAPVIVRTVDLAYRQRCDYF
jgi:hypothetical protein